MWLLSLLFYVVQEKETKAKKKYFHIVALPIETISHYMLLFSMLVNFFFQPLFHLMIHSATILALYFMNRKK